MTSVEQKLIKLRKEAMYVIWICMAATFLESGYLIGYRITLGFDAINTPFYWTEVVLASATFIMSFLATCGLESPTGALLVPFMMFLLPRVTAPIIFVSLARPKIYYIANGWLLFNVAMFALFCIGTCYMVLRYYRQLESFNAVDNFLKKKTAV